MFHINVENFLNAHITGIRSPGELVHKEFPQISSHTVMDSGPSWLCFCSPFLHLAFIEIRLTTTFAFRARFYLFIKDRRRQKEKQAPCGDPDAGLNPRTPGSCPELKADTQPLSHPGIPKLPLLLSLLPPHLSFSCDPGVFCQPLSQGHHMDTPVLVHPLGCCPARLHSQLPANSVCIQEIGK